MPGLGNDFYANLEKLKHFTDPDIIAEMEKAQTRVVTHAKANHERAPAGGGHPSDRYYDRRGMLTNSIRPGTVTVTLDSITGEVLAGGTAKGLVDYAIHVETGTSKSRAYPFMVPALEETAAANFQGFGEAIRKAIR